MDGLALLCNLFADGPVTLRRLRAARVENLRALERVPRAELCEILHASPPQASAFAEEGRKLAQRLSEETSARRPPEALVPMPRSVTVAASASVPSELTPAPRSNIAASAPSAGALALRAGLFAGLDEALVARLQSHGVRSVRGLIEFAGLVLARRTGIPYPTLLELARQARRFEVMSEVERAASKAKHAPLQSMVEHSMVEHELVEHESVEHGTPPAPELVEHELRPAPRRTQDRAPLRASEPAFRRAPEPVRSDEFTFPVEEPESAGPFV